MLSDIHEWATNTDFITFLFVLGTVVTLVLAPLVASAGVPTGDTGPPATDDVYVSASTDEPLRKYEGDTITTYGTPSRYFGIEFVNESVVAAKHVSGVRNASRCAPHDPPCSLSIIRKYNRENPRDKTTLFTLSHPHKKANEIHDVSYDPDRNEYVIVDMETESMVGFSPNGTVQWRWNASSYYDAPKNPTEQDWLHINDVDVIAPGEYMISVRNTHQLLLLEQQGNGNVGITEVVNKNRSTEILARQHNPQWLDDGRILVADSINNRIVELERQDNGRWTVAWKLTHAGGHQFIWPRDADRLPSGLTVVTDTRTNRVVAVHKNGSIAWGIETVHAPYESEVYPGEYSQSYPKMNGSYNPPTYNGSYTGGPINQMLQADSRVRSFDWYPNTVPLAFDAVIQGYVVLLLTFITYKLWVLGRKGVRKAATAVRD